MIQSDVDCNKRKKEISKFFFKIQFDLIYILFGQRFNCN